MIAMFDRTTASMSAGVPIVVQRAVCVYGFVFQEKE